MKKISLVLAFVCIGFGAPLSAHAVPVKGLLSLSGDFGGDTLIKLSYTDGSTATVQAGRGLSATAGVIVSPLETDAHALDLQSSISWKFATIPAASNQDVTWTRWPVDLLAFYRHVPAGLRVGAGAVYHLAPSLSASGSVINGDVSFDSGVGAAFQADYTLNKKILLGLRYTVLKYSVEGDVNSKINANSIGFTLGILFGG